MTSKQKVLRNWPRDTAPLPSIWQPYRGGDYLLVFNTVTLGRGTTPQAAWTDAARRI